MIGGESSIENAKNAVLGELKRQSELNGSTVFAYEPKYAGRIVAYANADDQKKILHLLDKQGKIKLSEKLVHNDATKQFEAMGGLPDDLLNSMKSERLIVDVSSTDFSDATTDENTSISVSILFDDEALYLKIANNEKRQIGKISYDSDVYKIFKALMGQQPGITFTSAAIFNERKNLKQILLKNRYECLFTLLDVTPYTIARKPEPMIISSTELKGLLSKINATYRKNFKDLE